MNRPQIKLAGTLSISSKYLQAAAQSVHLIHKPRSIGFTCAIGWDCDGHCRCWCKK